MSIDSSYGWESAKRSSYVAVPQSRNLRWWIFIAVLLSVFVHAVLYLVFLNWKTEWLAIGVSETPEMTRPVLPRQAKKADPDLLKPRDQKEDETRKLDVSELEEVDIDPLEVENLLERDVRFTAEFEKPANIDPSEVEGLEASASGIAPISLQVPSETLKEGLAKMNKNLLDQATRASVNQPILELPDDDLLKVDTNAALNDVVAQAGAEEGDSRYSTLDELISYGGPLGDKTKPIMMPTDVLFEFGEWKLLSNAKLSLMKLGILIQGNPETRFIIEGHTDTIGEDQFNMRLSLKRAEAVRTWLLDSLGFDPEQLDAIGLGETKIIADPEGDRDAQKKNRRVEIVMKTMKPKTPQTTP